VVKIRLKRMGTKKRPVYRIVVADSRSPRDGRFIEAIGFYDPLPNPAVVRVDEEKVRVWMRKGARPSESARFLLVQQGILAPLPRRERPSPSVGDGAGPAASGSPSTAPSVEPSEEAPAAAAEAVATAVETEPVSEPEPVAEEEG
jgi:small subunit ribosomal protein S16